MKLQVKNLLRITVSVFLISVLILKTDFLSAISILSESNLKWVSVGILAIGGNILISAFRLKYILKIYNLSKSIPYLIKLYLVGNFYNNFLPTQIGGDVYKAYKLSKDLKKTGEGTFTIFMDRFSGLVILYFIGFIGLFLTFGFQGLFLAVVLFLIGIAGYYWGLKIFSKKFSFVSKFKEANDIFIKNKKKAFNVFVSSVGVQFFALLTTAASLYAVGAKVPVWSIFLYTPIITIIGLFPSLNGIGVQDSAYVFFFSMTGISEEQAFAASILMHIMRFGTSLTGGGFVLLGWGKSKE